MIIIAGSANTGLAAHIGKALSLECIFSSISHFEDQESQITLKNNLYGQDVAIICSTSTPINDRLIELFLLIDRAKSAGAKNIIAVMPYFAYGRESASAALVAKLLESAGVDRVITLDLHSKQIEGFFRVSVDNLDSSFLFSPLFKQVEHVIVSPDIGGMTRAKIFSQALNSPLAVINKTRIRPGDCSMSEVMGEVKDKHCLIIDDIVDTANTLCKAADLLRSKGALSIKACVTHAVLSKAALEKITNSSIDSLYISNSIKHIDLPDMIKIIPIDTLIANSLRALL